jgi:mono/diheme cytochrome c family protein
MRKRPLSSSRPLLLLSALAAVVAVSFVVGFAQSTNDAVVGTGHLHQRSAQFEKVPKKARAWRNPMERDSNAMAAGQKLFQQHCAECHGNSAEGGRKAPSLRVEEVQQATPGTLFWILTNGVVRRGMPVWSKLPESQRWQIVTYLKSFGTSPAPFAPAPSSGRQ